VILFTAVGNFRIAGFMHQWNKEYPSDPNDFLLIFCGLYLLSLYSQGGAVELFFQTYL